MRRVASCRVRAAARPASDSVPLNWTPTTGAAAHTLCTPHTCLHMCKQLSEAQCGHLKCFLRMRKMHASRMMPSLMATMPTCTHRGRLPQCSTVSAVQGALHVQYSNTSGTKHNPSTCKQKCSGDHSTQLVGRLIRQANATQPSVHPSIHPSSQPAPLPALQPTFGWRYQQGWPLRVMLLSMMSSATRKYA
jgi:hypothetical protein